MQILTFLYRGARNAESGVFVAAASGSAFTDVPDRAGVPSTSGAARPTAPAM